MRTALPAEAVEDVILGQGYPNGEAPALGRVAALDAGLPIETPGMQLDRRCGAGLQAIMLGCMEVQTGVAELVLAGGAESMSQIPFEIRRARYAFTEKERAIVDAIHSGALDRAATVEDTVFGVAVPTSCPEVPAEILVPRNTWADKAAYDAQAKKVAALFRDNFKKYEAQADEAVVKKQKEIEEI